MISLLSFVILVSFFSMAWFVLGIIAGRNLPRSRGMKPTEGASRRKDSKEIEIYVGNLPYDMSDKDLVKAFKPYGSVAAARVISNRFTGKSRGFGFVEMDDRAEAEAAIRALNGKDLRGRRIVVNEAK